MIHAFIYKNKNDSCVGFRLSGHAGYDVHGKDIVCAAVSILVINTINSIELLTNDVIQVNIQEEEKGIIDVSFPSEISYETKLLIDSMILGLNGIVEDGNKKYLKVLFEEV